MKITKRSKKDKLKLSLTIPGDKSISHRAIMFNGLAKGTATITNLLEGEDVLATVQILRQLGAEIEFKDDHCMVTGVSGTFTQPTEDLYCGNSGTTMRLLFGLLAPQSISVRLTGDASLSRRPMGRVTKDLEAADVQYPTGKDTAPIVQKGNRDLSFLDVTMPIASAQVKSAMLLAGLQANGARVRGGKQSRDHSERLLRAMGANVLDLGNGDVEIQPSNITATDVVVPNDISSAAFFVVAALIHPQCELQLTNIGLNPTRTGLLKALLQMGGQITVENERTVAGEKVGDLIVKSSSLHGIDLPIEWVPTMIDELPILALAASQATGKTNVRGASDLRKKESDRIAAVVESFSQLGMTVDEYLDGFSIEGPQEIVGGTVNGYGDHRIVMTTAIASLFAQGEVIIESTQCVQTSFPNFWELLASFQ